MLDAYLKELAKVQQASLRRRPAAPVAAAPRRCRGSRSRPAVAAAVGRGRAPVGGAPRPAALRRGGPAAVPTSPAEAKQRGRWLLHEGREQLLRGNYDVAQQKVDEAERSTSSGGSSTTRPPRSSRKSTRPGPGRAAQAAVADANQPHDRRTAKAKLREARALLNNRQFEQAEAIALDVKSGACPTACSRTIPTRWPPRPGRCAAATRSATCRRASSRARASTTCWCRSRASS